MASEDANELYLKAVDGMTNDERSRFRNLLESLMTRDMELDRSFDDVWEDIIPEAIMISKTWISPQEVKAAMERMESGSDEYDEALSAQEIMDKIKP